MYEDVILIIGAMKDVELDVLLNKLELRNVVEEKSCTFYEGNLLNNNVVICHANVGIINAATATTLGIMKYNPKLIWVEGTAGGHAEIVHKGDIVVSTGIINLNSFRTGCLGKNEGSDPFSWELKRYGHLPQDVESIVVAASEKLIELAKSVENEFVINNPSSKVHYGIIGSGDAWNKEADLIKHYSAKYQTLCEEMESAAVFQIARNYDIPVIAIRSISNNEIHGEVYERELGQKAQEYVLYMLKNKKEK
ncbi:MAG: 5'-methylthioadenosine/S-adenosylhomocysteine nucleosidase [Clostridia bacterium]|nr:5'-methylthioadenosine/S-adenosylhomocysteine nucleosidase [Clostridia bacterium]